MEVDLENMKRVFVGDPKQRITMTMPVSLAKLLAQIREVYDVAAVELWLDPDAHVPGKGRILIYDESDYRTIADDDVIVFTSKGKVLDPTKLLTTYRADYIAKQLPMRVPPVLDDPPVVELPVDYNTTYRHDYVPKKNPFGETMGDVEVPLVSAPFHGDTTYRTDYVEKHLPKRASPPDNAWAMAPGANRHISTYAQDYPGHTRASLGKPNATPAVTMPPGAIWMPTEYRDHYVGAEPSNNSLHAVLNIDDDAPPCLPPNARTTYQNDYIPHALTNARIHVEPHTSK